MEDLFGDLPPTTSSTKAVVNPSATSSREEDVTLSMERKEVCDVLYGL